MGQLCGPTQVFKTAQLWRIVSEGGKKRGHLQQQLYLHLPRTHPLLHVRPTKECFHLLLPRFSNPLSPICTGTFWKPFEGFSLVCFGCVYYKSETKHSTDYFYLALNWLVLMFLLLSISSPMLLIALAVYAGAFYIIHLKSLDSKLVVLGELSFKFGPV